MRLRFGDSVFDGPARELRRGSRRVALTPKAFQLLELLLERRPGAVARSEIHDRLWPGTFVSHTSLPRLVTELRKALGDDRRRPRFIRTVQRFGYAFAAEAWPLDAAPPPRTARGLLWAGRRMPLREGENLLGRSPACTVRITSPRVSRLHARILVAGRQAVMEDLASKNGTFVNGRRVGGPVRLALGDAIGLGAALLVYCAFETEESTGTDRTD
jgi:DNA-binding winged helix-turn-helix (wHTH) protein